MAAPNLNGQEDELTAEEQNAVAELTSDYSRAMFALRGYRRWLLKPIAIALIKAGWRKAPIGRTGK